ncbi:unnamed protein product [Cladocopium goreaui]|uniref:Lissencephaly-1-like n=1 Tax=Cladocopium goreaui TaxID=2562237 RepID=A0A9P1GG46_9DINO|nr:unnamed protein product [Cladocopium goreaui]
MRFFVVFAALAPLLALRGASLGSSHDGSSMCPCIGKDDRWECVKEKLASYVSCPDDFGIGCKTHNISEDCAVSLYQSDVGKQLQCGLSHSGESPWCNTSWCYVNDSNCIVDWDWGVLGPYSYATCGNLRQGSDKYFQKSLAAFLQDDPLRVFHPVSTLEGAYLGNTECHEHYDAEYLTHQKCKGVVAEFWARSLDELNSNEYQVKVDHTIIRRVENDIENGIDQYFIVSNLTKAFEEYQGKFRENWTERPSNFDLCAFATGMGYVDLCSGAFALTHRRQQMTFMIELYTSPVFMVSKSMCDFLASDDFGSEKFWLWWVFVFSPGAWGFFVCVVFSFIVAMKCLDHCLDEQSGSAFAFQSKTSHRRDSNKPSRTRPSHVLRLGLGFFIVLSLAVYGAKITAEMVSAKQVKGEVPNLEKANTGPNEVKVCTHSVFKESLELHGSEKIVPVYSDTWKKLLENLEDKKCTAALLDDEAWNAFRSREKLCDFYKEQTADFYVPTGVVVSKRAYRTLETFRFDTLKTAVFFDKSKVPGHACHRPNSAEVVCDNIIKDGVPWYMLFSLFVVAAACAVCSCIAIYFRGEDEENEEEKKEVKREEDMRANIDERLERIDERIDRIDKKMKMANIQRLFDQKSYQRSQEVAGPPAPDATPKSQDPENPTDAAPSNPLPTSLKKEFRHPDQTAGAK